MKTKTYPRKTATAYSKGAERSLTVGLRFAEEHGLTMTKTLVFLRGLRDELERMNKAGDTENPVIDRAIQATLAKIGQTPVEAGK